MEAITALKLYRIIVATALALGILSGVAGAEDLSVTAVTASVQSSDISPPQRVVKRMELSVSTVGDQVLVGRKVADVLANKNSYEKLIKEVFDRVLVGYSVKQVLITPGQTTQINVLLSPWGDVVREVKLDLDLGGMPPETAAMIKQDMGNIDAKINDVFIGMPVDSLDWATGISTSLIREMLAAQLPEFRVNLEIIGGQSTVVKLSLIPAGAMVQDVKVTLRSKSIPNILLLETSGAVEDAAGIMRGLPVAFVERHSEDFNNLLMAAANKRPVVKRYGLKISSEINAATDTEVFVNAETDKYKVTLEGYLDIGRLVDSTSARLHIGEYIGKHDEMFLETTFIPGSVSWQFAPGWGHQWGKTQAGVKYEIDGGRGNDILWLRQDLGGRWLLRLERTPATGYTELGIRYKLHDFISAEYVITNNDKWLRLVGNL